VNEKRNYQQKIRRVGSDLARGLVLHTALTVLSRPAGFASFSMEAIAREAGVARMTVFNLFGSRQGLLRAVCDEIAQREALSDATELLNDPDVRQALLRYVAAFVQFYTAHRQVLKALRGFAAFDEDFAAVVRERDDKRLAGLAYLVRRWHVLSASQARSRNVAALVATLRAMLAFEVFELLSQSGEDGVWIARQMALALAAVLDTPLSHV
jgi:AcrR family transcriptional regulator